MAEASWRTASSAASRWSATISPKEWSATTTWWALWPTLISARISTSAAAPLRLPRACSIARSASCAAGPAREALHQDHVVLLLHVGRLHLHGDRLADEVAQLREARGLL